MAAKSDYYDTLGITKSATAAEIKSAYRKKALEWHPDKHKDDKEEAERKFKEINEAYQVLSDPQKKSAYDQYGHSAFSQGAGGFPGGFGGGQAGQWGPFTYTYTSGSGGASSSPFGGFDFNDPFEIFEQFFGGGSPFRRPSKPRYSIDISFTDAVHGAEKEVRIDSKTKKIKIPAGVDDGSRIEFQDFTLSINVLPDTIFQRDGYDVVINIDIPISAAILGDNIQVPTIDGDIKVKIRPGTQPGSLIRLKGKGIPHLRGRGRGDQYIRLRVAIPQKLNSATKKLIQQLQEKGL